MYQSCSNTKCFHLSFHRFRDVFSSKHNRTTICGHGHSNLHLKIAQGLFSVDGQDAQDESFYERIGHG